MILILNTTVSVYVEINFMLMNIKNTMSAPHITWFVNTNIIRPITIKERPKVSIFDNLIMDNIRNEKIFFERDKK